MKMLNHFATSPISSWESESTLRVKSPSPSAMSFKRTASTCRGFTICRSITIDANDPPTTTATRITVNPKFLCVATTY